MTTYTQKAILETFEEMLGEMPFDKITVSALVARCDISPNTFYYHYRDIFDLLNAWVNSVQSEFIPNVGELSGWPEKLKAAMHAMQDHPKLVYHVFDSISRERMERYIFDSVEDTFYEYIKHQVEVSDVSEENLRVISSFCCHSLLGFILKFIWGHMSVDVDSSVDKLSEIFDGTIEYVIKRSSDRKTNSEPEK